MPAVLFCTPFTILTFLTVPIALNNTPQSSWLNSADPALFINAFATEFLEYFRVSSSISRKHFCLSWCQWKKHLSIILLHIEAWEGCLPEYSWSDLQDVHLIPVLGYRSANWEWWLRRKRDCIKEKVRLWSELATYFEKYSFSKFMKFAILVLSPT